MNHHDTYLKNPLCLHYHTIHTVSLAYCCALESLLKILITIGTCLYEVCFGFHNMAKVFAFTNLNCHMEFCTS